MTKIDFDMFSSVVLKHKWTEITFEFVTQSGHGLQASMSSLFNNNLTKEEALIVLHFKRACFYEEWDIELFNNTESLKYLFSSYFNPLFQPLPIEDFWTQYEKLVQRINFSNHNVNKYKNKYSDLYLRTNALKYSEIETDDSLQENLTILNPNNIIQFNNISDCFLNNDVTLQTSYFIETNDKYYLIVENIIC